MSGSRQPPSNDRSSSAPSSGDWFQRLLFGVGALLFIGAIAVMVGVPGVPLSGSIGDGGVGPALTPPPAGSPSPGGAGTSGPTASPPPSGGTASPSADGTATPASKQAGTSVYRVNVGGRQLLGANGPDWSSDTPNNPSRFLNVERSETVATDTPDEIRLAKGIPRSAPNRMFNTYRISKGGDKPRYEEMVWRFPVNASRTYEVRLYVVEAFFTDGEGGREYEQPYQENGPRHFGVAVNGETVLQNYEPFVEHGHDVGAMQTFEVTAEDGVITIRFVREVENPTVSGIEIVDTGPRVNQTGTPTNQTGTPTDQFG